MKAHTFFSATEKRAALKELTPMFQEHDSLWVRLGKARPLIEEYAARLSPSDPKSISIADCGCSGGTLLEQLKAVGFTNLHGVDFEDFLRNKEVATFHKTDFNFEPLPFPDASLDMIVSIETVEHLENPMHFEREVARVLKPNGIFIFSMPNIFHIWNRIGFLRTGDMFRYHEHNDHFAVMPRGVFKKIFLRDFTLLETRFDIGELPYRFFAKFTYPANELFGRSICRILEKKSEDRSV